MADSTALSSNPDAARLLSGDSWRQWCDRLKAAGERILEPDFPDDPRARTEGFRALTRLLVYATQLEVEASDPLFPDFYRYEDPRVQWGGPNPDNTYLRAVIDPKQTYKIWADVDGMHQAIFCQHEGDMQLGQYGVYHERDIEDFEIDEDGFLELILSPEEHEGNWIPCHPDARFFTIRIYVSNWENHTSPTFHIERVGAEGSSPPCQRPEELAQALDRAMQWIERSSIYWNDYARKSLEGATPNAAGEVRATPGGADRIAYGSCFWDLTEEQALLLICEPPQASYWGFTTHTMAWLESGDFARRQTSLSGDQVYADEDGLVRLVVAHEDPGVPNWIDTSGHRRGLLAYRWVWSETMPTPRSEVVPLEEIYEHLPDDHPQLTEGERRQALSIRREALWESIRVIAPTVQPKGPREAWTPDRFAPA